MLYEKGRELVKLSIERWKNEEVFSFGWWFIVLTLVGAYILWIIMGDKSKSSRMLLIGSMSAVAYTLNSLVLGEILGLVNYNVRLFPLNTVVFMSSITLAPIIIMLSEQYSSSWKGYLLRSGLGFAFLCLVIFSLYTLAKILVWHNWNVFYHFIVLFGVSIGVRFVFLLILGVEKRNSRF